MADAVAEAIANSDKLVVEAGTGTGKTFAYLVPALSSGRRVLISTGTRALQDQLFKRDLPTVAGAIGMPVKVALLKGRANYLCTQRAELATAQSGTSATHLRRVRDWAQGTRVGDIAELTAVPEHSPIWPAVTSTADNCLGQDCPRLQHCHVLKARRKAASADIVVVNHHLLLADLALKDGGFGELLPEADVVIVDEAHQVPGIAAQFFGTTITQGQVIGLARDLLAEALKLGLAADFEPAADRLLLVAREARLAMGTEARRFNWSDLSASAIESLLLLRDGLSSLADLLEPVAEAAPGLENCMRRAQEQAQRLQDLLEPVEREDDQVLRWVETFSRSFALHVTPLEPAESLGEAFQGRPCSWVFTSATLAVGEDFGHFTARVGLREAQTIKLDSPFDFDRNALLYLPAALPDPRDRQYTEAVLERALPVIEASGGRAFLLFTSYRALNVARGWLADRIQYPLLVQGAAPRDALLAQFREMGNAVLLGTSSFWEGVDVRGEALSLVVIDKLPFASPGEPLMRARLSAMERRGDNPFRDFQLPQAVIALKQGVGRLIRDHSDRGVMMICDPRLTTRSYGKTFLKSLPPMRRTQSMQEVCEFLQPAAEAGSLAPAVKAPPSVDGWPGEWDD